MADVAKFNAFVEQLVSKVHDLLGSGGSIDDLRLYLTNVAPDAVADVNKADLAEIADTDTGYTAGGESVTPVGSRTLGVYSLLGTAITWTCIDAGIGPFHYAVLYNNTAAGDPLIQWWDHGEEVTLAVDETFTIRFDGEAGQGTILTLQ